MVVVFSLCTKCGAQTQTDDRYCQDCGQFIARTSRVEFSASMDDKPVKRKFLDIFRSSNGQPAILLPILASTVGLVALIPICMYAIENSYNDISHKYLNDKALEAIQIGHTTEAIEIMTREQIEHSTLRQDQLAILDQAFYKRSAQFMESNNFTSALADLYRITPKFPKNLVDQRVAECNKGIADQGKHGRSGAAAPKADANQPKVKSMIEPTVPTQTPQSAALPVSTPPAVAATPTTTTTTPLLSRQSGLSQKLLASLKKRHIIDSDRSVLASSPDRQTSPLGAQVDAQSSGSKPDATASGAASESASASMHSGRDAGAGSQDFVPTDVVRYNELLATYFSRNHKTKSEPPTFKEWVKAGRASF